MNEPIKGADAPLWEAPTPKPRCACGTLAYYQARDGVWRCPMCWHTAGSPK